MTPAEFRNARLRLSLNQTDLAEVMGYSGQPQISAIENATTDVAAQSSRLMESYMGGWRPRDWPTRVIGKAFPQKLPTPETLEETTR